MAHKLDVRELALSRKVGKIFEYACNKGYPPVAFAKRWLESRVFYLMVDMAEDVISQSYLYIFTLFEEEVQMNLLDEPDFLVADAMYWTGYLCMYWCFYEGITGKDILNHYDIASAMQCYDVLHTLDVRRAIEEIKEEHKQVFV